MRRGGHAPRGSLAWPPVPPPVSPSPYGPGVTGPFRQDERFEPEGPKVATVPAKGPIWRSEASPQGRERRQSWHEPFRRDAADLLDRAVRDVSTRSGQPRRACPVPRAVRSRGRNPRTGPQAAVRHRVGSKPGPGTLAGAGRWLGGSGPDETRRQAGDGLGEILVPPAPVVDLSTGWWHPEAIGATCGLSDRDRAVHVRMKRTEVEDHAAGRRHDSHGHAPKRRRLLGTADQC